jgi:hypothetical protein
MDLTDPEYALAWPREVFVAEALGMMQTAREDRSFRADYGLLLEEAFMGDAPAREYSARGYTTRGISALTNETVKSQWSPSWCVVLTNCPLHDGDRHTSPAEMLPRRPLPCPPVSPIGWVQSYDSANS